MNSIELGNYLSALIATKNTCATMIWGAPGIGKSAIVKQVANAHDMQLVDLRLSQLAPTDLRGIPVPDGNVAKWLPPEFLPKEGRGVLFLDEINMAPPAMQGIAQQLILDRRVGSYVLPNGWFVWAAGNRFEDRAAVYSFSAPLANRFLHLELFAELDTFKSYGFANNLHSHIISFLNFRPELLHSMTDDEAWPSPRSWEMASQLHTHDLSILPAVGRAASAEFNAFVKVVLGLPDIRVVLDGGENVPEFPTELSQRYAITGQLVYHAENALQISNALQWILKTDYHEYASLTLQEFIRKQQSASNGTVIAELAKIAMQDKELRSLLSEAVKSKSDLMHLFDEN